MLTRSERVLTATLSARERDVLRLIAQDLTYAQIANELHLGFDTVKAYANRLRAKLGTQTKVGLALFAVRNKLTGV
jgi:DNA-binding CsgD family transcriptional regulator